MFNRRLPFGRSYGSDPAPPMTSNQRGSIYGVPDVRFNEVGQPLVPGNERQQAPTNMLLWRQNGGPGQPANDQANWRYRQWSSSPEGVEAYRSPIITRRYDRELPYVTTGMGGVTNTRVRTTMTPETIVVEEMKIYDQKPCAWWLFIVVGILMVVLGVLNILWCWELHYFCRFWTGVFLILVGIFGAIHTGDYVTKWKSWLYIIVGLIATAMVMVSSFLVLRSLIHQIIEIAQWQGPEYIATQEERYTMLKLYPMMNLTNWDWNIWVCIGLDAVDVVLLAVSFIVHSSVLLVVDRYFNSHYAITRKVEPFCEPWLFNPWGQSSLGQAILFIGFVLNGIPYGTYKTAFQDTYAGIWGGILPIVAGPVAALALKSCSIKRRLLSILALILELGSIVVSIVAIILLTLGIADNITTLIEGGVMLVTDFPKIMMVVSSFAFAFADMAAVVNVFYSLSLIIRLLYCFCTNCCGKDLTKTETEQVVEETKYLDADKGEDRVVQSTQQEVSYPYSRPFITRSNAPGFDPYRPAGARSFYMQ